MEELTDEGKVKPVLPFLDNGRDSLHVLCRLGWVPRCTGCRVLASNAGRAQGLYKSFIGELEVLSGTTVLTIQCVMHS